MRYVFIVLAALLISASAQFSLVWRNLPAGATVDQVKKMLPGVSTPSEPSILLDRQTKGLLEYRDFQLADIDFKATLYFKQGKLSRVLLNPLMAPGREASRVAALKLRDSLIAKYGTPMKEGKGPMIMGIRDDVIEWSQNGTLIKFSYHSEKHRSGFLQILYIAPQDTLNI